MPLRLELGPRDIANNTALAVRRYDGHKAPMSLDNIATNVKKSFEEIHEAMYAKAKKDFDEHLINVTKWEDVVPTLDKKSVLVMPWCEEEKCEDAIKERSESQ